MNPLVNDLSTLANLPPWLLTLVIVWSLLWKGLALWKSARRNSSVWFVVLLVVNTIGILEILYIFLFSELKLNGKNPKKEKPKQAIRKKFRKQRALLE